MAKGLLILFIVFTAVGMLHVTTLRLIKTAEHKKQKIPIRCIGIVIDVGREGIYFPVSTAPANVTSCPCSPDVLNKKAQSSALFVY